MECRILTARTGELGISQYVGAESSISEQPCIVCSHEINNMQARWHKGGLQLDAATKAAEQIS